MPTRLGPGAALRLVCGLLLLVLSTLPIYRWLGPDTGLAGAATVGQANQYAALLWAGFPIVLLLGLAVAVLLPEQAAARHAGRAARWLVRVPLRRFAAVCALCAGAGALAVGILVFEREPNFIDALSQLVQARYVAAGRLAGPTSPLGAFWHLPQTVVTPHGWVSQYPPLHVLLLGAGMRLGAVWLVGPLTLAATVFLTALLAERLFRTDRLVARLGTILLAASPFAWAHAAAYMNHTTAACCAVAALYAAARLRDGAGVAAAAGLGLALALLAATRPLTALVVGAVIAGWYVACGHARPRLRLVAFAAASASPVLLLLGWYNARFFGSPLRFGYSAVLGPHAGLGFGLDPWGNVYGLRAAIGYTAAELGTLNVFLLETPVPAVTLVALFLLLPRRLDRGAGVTAAWALAPLLAHLAYWHHGLFMGPRMLNEYAPAWCLLVASAAIQLVRAAPAALRSVRPSPRVFAGATLGAGWLIALLWLAPARLLGYRESRLAAPNLSAALVAAAETDTAPVNAIPAAKPGAPVLVFVHGSWATRIGMRLAARGMRLDSLDALVRQNSTCSLQLWLDSGTGEVRADPERGAAAETLPRAEPWPGSRVRLRPGEPWPAVCARELAADRSGVLEVAPLLWRQALPGLRGRVHLARDLGPEANQRLIAASNLPAYVLRAAPGGVRLQPYRTALDSIWSPAPGDTGAGAPPGSTT